MKTDAQLKIDVMEELRWEPNVTSDSINVAAHKGVVTLTGSVPFFAEKWATERAVRRVSGVKAIAEDLQVNRFGIHNHKDTDVAQAVVNALSWHVWVPDTVQATVENGWVKLNGSVKWEFERHAAEEALRYLSGVTGISNDILLKPAVQPSAVKDSIEKALKRTAEIDADNIKVSTSGSKVTLTGNTHSWNERAEAGSAAWCAPGVTEVQNNLAVSL